jgi:hypothetical protein
MINFKTWKEAAVAEFKALSRYLHGGADLTVYSGRNGVWATEL